MKLNNYFIGLLVCFCSSLFLVAQDKVEETLQTQEIFVVKSYTPSLSDAFKINDTPQVPDSLKGSNKILTFKIKPVAVVSTFEPNKASPLKLKKRNSSTPYNTFFSGGFGTMRQMYFNVSSVVELDRTQRFGINLYRDGFGSDVRNSLWKSNQNFNQFGVHHNLRSRDYNVNTQIQFNGQNNNYYGLYERNWDKFLIEGIEPSIKRNFFKFRTDWDWFDSVLRSMAFQANSTSDNFNTSEQQLALQVKLGMPLGGGTIQTTAAIKGFHTAFSKPFFTDLSDEFTQGLGQVGFQWLHTNNDLKLKLGAGVSYLEGEESLNSKFNYYPELEIFYQKNGNVVAPYLMARGGVVLNNYRTSVLFNPFLAPTTYLKPQFNKYNASLGMRSSLSSIINFDFGVLFDQIENFQFYERLPMDIQEATSAYRLSNAYQNQYVNVNTYGVKAQIRIDLAKNNFVHFETRYKYYDVNDNLSIQNVPSLQMNWKGQFRFKEFVTLSFDGEVYGDRSALEHVILQDNALKSSYFQEIKLPIFYRSTAHLTVKLNSQFDAFVKGRFSNSQSHGQWAFFQEPRFMVLGGITYRFDFQY